MFEEMKFTQCFIRVIALTVLLGYWNIDTLSQYKNYNIYVHIVATLVTVQYEVWPIPIL